MKTYRSPPTLMFAYLTLALAPLLAILALFQPDRTGTQPLLLLASGCLALAIGEILNHPRQTDCNFTEDESSELRRIPHRRRNPCMLGNLLFFVGALFLFAALGHFISA